VGDKKETNVIQMIFQNAPKSFRESKINSKKIKQNTNIDEDIQKE